MKPKPLPARNDLICQMVAAAVSKEALIGLGLAYEVSLLYVGATNRTSFFPVTKIIEQRHAISLGP